MKWIKVSVEAFDDEKLLMIADMPRGDSILVLWFKLLCLAGKKDNNGVFDRRLFSVETFAKLFHFL